MSKGREERNSGLKNLNTTRENTEKANIVLDSSPIITIF